MNRIIIFFLPIFLLTKIAICQHITIVTEDWPPFNYMKGQEVVGVSTAIVKATLNHAGLEYKIRSYPWARAYRKALYDDNTLIYTIARTKEREDLFKWIGPFASRKMYLFKLKSRKDIQLKSFEDLKRYKIAVFHEDATHQQLIKRGFPEKQLQKITSANSNILMLAFGKVDLIPANEFALISQLKSKDVKVSLLHYKNSLSYHQVEKAYLLVDKGGYYMAFSKKTSDQIVVKVRKAFDEISQQGIVEKLINDLELY